MDDQSIVPNLWECKLHNLILFEIIFRNGLTCKHIVDLDLLKGVLIELSGAKGFDTLHSTWSK
jgi:hypothetical protein